LGLSKIFYAFRVRPRDQNAAGKIDESCWLRLQKSDLEVDQESGRVITSPTLLGPVLVWSQQNYEVAENQMNVVGEPHWLY